MGVSGSGKTTIGQLLAKNLHWQFYDGDHFHRKANVDRMGQGIALIDEDRASWIKSLRNLIGDLIRQRQAAVITCSALKQTYRPCCKSVANGRAKGGRGERIGTSDPSVPNRDYIRAGSRPTAVFLGFVSRPPGVDGRFRPSVSTSVANACKLEDDRLRVSRDNGSSARAPAGRILDIHCPGYTHGYRGVAPRLLGIGILRTVYCLPTADS